MAKAPPSFQFYPGDFVTGTAHLDAEAIGCYLLLLCFQWMHTKLPNDTATLARICKKTSADFAPIWGLISEKFIESADGHLLNNRLETVRANALMVSQKRSAIGRIGGKANASRLLKQKQSKGRLKVEDRRVKSKEKEMDAEFEKFWGLVSNKVGRGKARAAYEKAIGSLSSRPGSPHVFLQARMAAFSQSAVGRGEYCPHPATWLNQERYDDDEKQWNRNGKQSTETAHAPTDSLFSG